MAELKAVAAQDAFPASALTQRCLRFSLTATALFPPHPLLLHIPRGGLVGSGHPFVFAEMPVSSYHPFGRTDKPVALPSFQSLSPASSRREGQLDES